MRQRGFTVVELAIVIVIIAILLVLATVSFRGLQQRAEDKERDADVQAIAAYLESIYPREIRSSTGQLLKPAGSYPSREWLYPHTKAAFDVIFAGIEPSALIAPGAGGAMSLYPSQNHYTADNITMANILPRDRLDGASTYLYLPLVNERGRPCVNTAAGQECRMFQIYYRLKGGPGGGEYKLIESRHR